VGGAPIVTEMPMSAARNDPSRRNGKATVLTFAVPENVPVDRVTLDIDPAQPNFRRSVQVTGEKDLYIGSGEIDRVHMVRSGQKIDSDQQDVSFSTVGQKTIKVIIDNGDDPPLKLRNARLQQLEHRLYFEAPASAPLTLYYGDESWNRLSMTMRSFSCWRKMQRPRSLAERKETQHIWEGRMNVRGQRDTRRSCGLRLWPRY